MADATQLNLPASAFFFANGFAGNDVLIGHAGNGQFQGGAGDEGYDAGEGNGHFGFLLCCPAGVSIGRSNRHPPGGWCR